MRYCPTTTRGARAHRPRSITDKSVFHLYQRPLAPTRGLSNGRQIAQSVATRLGNKMHCRLPPPKHHRGHQRAGMGRQGPKSDVSCPSPTPSASRCPSSGPHSTAKDGETAGLPDPTHLTTTRGTSKAPEPSKAAEGRLFRQKMTFLGLKWSEKVIFWA